MSQGTPTPRQRAIEVANEFIKDFLPFIEQAVICGSIRRGLSMVNDIDVVMAVHYSMKLTVDFLLAERFGTYTKEFWKGKRSGVFKDIPIQVMDVSSSSLGAAMLTATGNATFNIIMRQKAIDRNWKLNQYGLWTNYGLCRREVCDASTEEAIFAALEYDYKKPEERSY